MKRLFWIVSLVAAGTMFNEANAQVNNPAQNHFGWQQGVPRSGVTPGEAAMLRKQKREIRKDVRAAKCNDGRIGAMERKHIRKEVNQFKRQRFMAQHNSRGRI